MLAGLFYVLAFAIICVAIPTIGPVSLSVSSALPLHQPRMSRAR